MLLGRKAEGGKNLSERSNASTSADSEESSATSMAQILRARDISSRIHFRPKCFNT